jgi:hypothetical protein
MVIFFSSFFSKMTKYGLIKGNAINIAYCSPSTINLEKRNKRSMGHIAHLRNLGPYRNIFPISNMHFISISPSDLRVP